MATVTRLQVFPQSFEHCFKHHHWSRQPVVLRPGLCLYGLRQSGRGNGMCSKQCRSFRREEGEVDQEKERVLKSARKCRSLKESEGKLETGTGFWKSFKTTILGGFGSAHADEYNTAVAKVEKVLSLVSYICFMLSLFWNSSLIWWDDIWKLAIFRVFFFKLSFRSVVCYENFE